MATETTDKTASDALKPAGYRIGQWLKLVPIGKTKFYTEKNAGRIKTRKCGDATIVETQPGEYIASLPAG